MSNPFKPPQANLGDESHVYKIIYHLGVELNLKIKALPGKLTIKNNAVCIVGKTEFEIPLSSIQKADIYHMHGLGRVIKLIYKEGTIFFTPVRVNLFGYFVIVNTAKCSRLFNFIDEKLSANNT